MTIGRERLERQYDDGKYTVIFDDGRLYALRHGEPWRDLTGDKLVLAMLQEALAPAPALSDEPDPDPNDWDAVLSTGEPAPAPPGEREALQRIASRGCARHIGAGLTCKDALGQWEDFCNGCIAARALAEGRAGAPAGELVSLIEAAQAYADMDAFRDRRTFELIANKLREAAALPSREARYRDALKELIPLVPVRTPEDPRYDQPSVREIREKVTRARRLLEEE